MTKCSICGKKGLFLKVDGSGRCQDCVRADALRKSIEQEMLKSAPEYAKMKKDLDDQDALLKTVWDAREQYDKDGNIDALINAYEYALIKSNPPLSSNSHAMYLSNLYIKSEQFEKAWGYLNGLLLTHRDLTGKIRAEQSRILKKEGSYSYALEMLMLSFLYESEWKNSFDKDGFIKKATPIANKLKWDEDKVEYLAHLIDSQVKRKNYDEGLLSDDYKKVLEQFES